MRLGKRERAIAKEQERQRIEAKARAALVPDTPGRPRSSLDQAHKGFVIVASRPQWDYLPKRVNGVARHSQVRKAG